MTLLHQAAQKAVEALKPCPFCGNAAEHRERNGGYFVQCDTCDTRTASRLRPDYAAAHWNQRESALQQQPEPVARSAHMCGMQGFDGMLDICPACEARRAPPALQHQEVPREPVAPPSMSMYASAADYSAAMDGWIATTRQCPVCKGKFGVDGQACDLCNATGRVPSTTRQQEVGSEPPGCEGCNCAACELRRKHEAAAPSTPEKAGGVSDGVGEVGRG